METFEQKALDYFGALTINKSFARKAGFGSRAIPVYVREWIVSHYVKDAPDLEEEARTKIADFVHKYAPDKSDREAIKNRLFEMQDVKLLDDYSVQVNLAKGDRYLVVPFLDETKGVVPPHIIRDNDMLLTSGIWGVATLSYAPPSDATAGQIVMRDFLPFQLSNLNLDYFIGARQNFSTVEWLDFIVNSMGFNHRIYNERQKILLVSRMLPMVESRYNLIELAPKGTGKSFVFENLSRYVAVRSGAISAPVLFFNDARKTPGLITRYDCVVIDEAQKVRGDSSGELTALLKSYLESGRFGRGSAGAITSESGLVMLANIELDEHHRPSNESIGLMRAFPNFLRETAFIDRFSGLLPGWDLPRVTKDTPSSTIALKGDIFGEILHMIRNDISYRDFVKTNMELNNCDDMRDSRAVEAGTSGFLKILFPNKQPSEADFYQYCVNPAIELRQRVRDELCKLDREYAPVTFTSKLPDAFQRNHRPARYVDPENIEQFLQHQSEAESQPLLAADEEEAELLAFFGESEAPNSIEPGLSEEEKLIQRGEGVRLEFKSTLRWSIKGNRNDSAIEHSALKTIVAFLNSEGGTLLIGVDDDGNILGTGVDRFPNDDKFLLHFANLINDKIGKHYADQIRWALKEIGEKKILRIDCRRSPTPVSLKWDGKEEFYIRSGPSTVPLSISDVLEYTKKHFR